MNYQIENPFADYGKIVCGERFIGRKNIMNVIENRIVQPENPGNLAIIGVHRIGKSSLVYKTIIEQKDKLIAKQVLPIWIGLSSYKQPMNFFRALITKCVREIRRLNWLSDEIQGSAELALEALKDEDPWAEITDFFIEVQEAGYGTLFILDEFDHARHLFEGETAFQYLRELADYPDYRLSLILTSRRNVRDIEHAAGSSSPFHNIFQVQRLAMFNDEDLETYFSLFSSIGIQTTDADQERILFYCGAHPYLLEMLGCEIVEMFRQNEQIDVDKAANAIFQSIFQHYDDMIRLLRDDGTLNKLLQILFGPVVDVKQTDVTELQNYGLIKPTEDATYAAYSAHFHDYLKLHERSTEFEADLWPIWRDTEKALREVITTTMSTIYGNSWIEKLEKGRSNLKLIFDKCRKAQQKEEKSFVDRASQNLIDFTYPADLFTIICAKGLWDPHFKPIFGHNPNYWERHKQLLARCRNPLAHNRSEVLQPHEITIIEGYCQEILNVLTPANSS